MRIATFLLLFLAFFVFNAFAQNAAGPVGQVNFENWGEVKDGKFVSTKLGLSMEIPVGSTVISTAEGQILREAGRDALKQGDGPNKQIDAAINRSINVLAVAEKPLGTAGNSIVEIVAVRQQKGVTASMSLSANVMVLKESPYKLKKSLGSLKVGQNSFAAADLEGKFGEQVLYHRMFVVIHKGYSINIGLVYLTDAQRIAWEKVLATIKLS